MAGTITPSFPKASTSALPDALRDLASRVTRETRLWPSEKSDLRAELESHFREGLIELTEGGMSVEESIATLRDDFGDPKLAAMLIRRSKKRGRPMIWKVLVGIGSAMLVVCVLGGGWAAYVTYGTPTPTVDYVAKLNAPLAATPEQDRAWPLLKGTLLEMTPFPKALESTKNKLPGPGDENWNHAIEWLAGNRRLIKPLMDAAAKPAYGFVYGNEQSAEYLRTRAQLDKQAQSGDMEWDVDRPADPLAPPTLALLLPHLQDMRSAAKLLVIDSRDSLSRGDFESAWNSLDAAFRLGTHAMSGRTLIEQLVGVAVMSLAMTDMRSALQSSQAALNTDRLDQINRSAVITASANLIKFDMMIERFFFDDVLQYVFTDDGTGNGRLIPGQYGKIMNFGMAESDANQQSDAGLLAIAAVHADRAATLAKYIELSERMSELYELPLYDPRRETAGQLLASELPSDGEGGGKFALVRTLMPNLSMANQMLREAAMDREVTIACIKLATFIATRGYAPKRLGELAPEYISRIPTDIYTGTHVRYEVRDDGSVLVYSVGRNLTDEGGSTDRVLNGGRQASADIVYWGKK